MIEPDVDAFLQYRQGARNNSEHTVRAYAADLAQFCAFVAERPLTSLDQIDLAVLRAFLAALQGERYARATLARKQAALRAFFRWAKRGGRTATDPTRGLRNPRQERKLPKFLRPEE